MEGILTSLVPYTFRRCHGHSLGKIGPDNGLDSKIPSQSSIVTHRSLPQRRYGTTASGKLAESSPLPEGPSRHLKCLAAKIDSPLSRGNFLTRKYPRPACLLKCLPNFLSPTRGPFFFLSRVGIPIAWYKARISGFSP